MTRELALSPPARRLPSKLGMKTSFLGSPGGRLMTGTVAFALLSVGALAAAGPGSHEIVFVSAIPLICIVAAIFSVGLSINEHGTAAAVMVVSLPIVAGPYLGILLVAPKG